jgi:hypothetical protein
LIDKHRFTSWGQISSLSPPGLVDGIGRVRSGEDNLRSQILNLRFKSTGPVPAPDRR